MVRINGSKREMGDSSWECLGLQDPHSSVTVQKGQDDRDRAAAPEFSGVDRIWCCIFLQIGISHWPSCITPSGNKDSSVKSTELSDRRNCMPLSVLPIAFSTVTHASAEGYSAGCRQLPATV